jgi:hypothetical protein
MISAGHSGARTAATILGAPLAALALGSLLARLLPVSELLAFAWGAHVIVPAWIALTCWLPLQKNGLRAWAVCAVLVLPAVGCALSDFT